MVDGYFNKYPTIKDLENLPEWPFDVSTLFSVLTAIAIPLATIIKQLVGL